MYRPSAFAVDDRDRQFELIEGIGFGTLISTTQGRIELSHLPFLVDRATPALRGHFARANAHWKALMDGDEVRVSFVGPNAYISPTWYISANQVPTWNYVAVEVSGTVSIEPDKRARLAIVTDLSARHERELEPPWTSDNVDPDRLDALLDAIVAFRIHITAVEAKAKLSQNRDHHDTAAAAAALEQRRGESDSAAIARLMRAALGKV